MASVPYSRSTLFNGLPACWVERLNDILDNRLSASSMRSVTTAANYWYPLAELYGWPRVIVTDDQSRGAKLVTFVLHLLQDTALVADSISNYVWGLRWYMKLQHQADPIFGVLNWHDFMVGVRVLAHVPHEPRRAVPMELIYAIAAAIDETSYEEVSFFFFLLVLLFTYSRSECPCPKSWTGRESWDDDKHWMVRDIVIKLVDGVWVLAVRFKAIKQDPRIERPEARGDGTDRGASRKGGSDWSYVGPIPGHPLNPFRWYRLLMGFYSGPRPPTAPFFMARDRVRPYTYGAAMSDFRMHLRRVSPSDTEYALHGLRVTGWNEAKRTCGEDVAEAHGGWKPGSSSRYTRFNLRKDIFGMAAAMVAPRADDLDVDDSGAPRVITPRAVTRSGRDEAAGGSAGEDDGSETPHPSSDDDEGEGDGACTASGATAAEGDESAHHAAARNIAYAAAMAAGGEQIAQEAVAACAVAPSAGPPETSPSSGAASARRHRAVTRLLSAAAKE